MKIKKHVIDKHLDDIERYSAFYNQTGMEKLFESVQGSKDMVWGLIEKQQKEIERFQYEASRVEDFIMAFAETNNKTGFISKWGNKLYSDADHTLYNMLEDLLIEP